MLKVGMIGPMILLTLSVGTAQAQQPEATQAPTMEEALELFGFEAGDRERLLEGEIVSHGFEELSDKELAVRMAVLLPTPMSDLLDFARSGRALEINQDVLAVGRLDGGSPGATAFADAKFTGSELSEVDALLKVRPGAKLNLSDAEMKRFAKLREQYPAKGCAREAACSSAVMAEYRKILLDRLTAYREGGLDGIASYAREDGKRSDPAEELRTATAAMKVLSKRFPHVHAALEEYPAGDQSGIEHDFLWVKRTVQDRPTFVLAHRLFHVKEGFALAVERHFFVGQSYNSLQIAAGLIPMGEKTIVFYLNRTSTDQVAGFMSGTRHNVGRKIMEKEIRKQFQEVLANLGARR